MTPETTEKNDARPNGPDKPKRDFRQEVTDQIVQMLESGVAPWQKPWEKGSFGMPFNPATENEWQVRKGEKGTQIEYWEYPTRQVAAEGEMDSPNERLRDKEPRPIHR